LMFSAEGTSAFWPASVSGGESAVSPPRPFVGTTAYTMSAVVFDYRRFFALGEHFARGTFRAHALGEIPGGDPYALTRRALEPEALVRFHHDEGSRIKDHIGTTWAVLHLV